MKRVIILPTERNSYYKQCGRKVKYRKKDAVTKAKAAALFGAAKTMGIYHCDFCNMWHLTHNLQARER